MRAKRQSVNAHVIGIYESVSTDIERVRAISERINAGCDIFCVSYFECIGIDAEHTGRYRSFVHLQYGRAIANIAHDRESAEIGNKLAHFESFVGKVGRLDRQARDIAARSRQTRDEAAAAQPISVMNSRRFN